MRLVAVDQSPDGRSCDPCRSLRFALEIGTRRHSEQAQEGGLFRLCINTRFQRSYLDGSELVSHGTSLRVVCLNANVNSNHHFLGEELSIHGEVPLFLRLFW